MDVLEREKQRDRAGALGSTPGGNANDIGGPGGMGKKSSSTSQLSAAGNIIGLSDFSSSILWRKYIFITLVETVILNHWKNWKTSSKILFFDT